MYICAMNNPLNKDKKDRFEICEMFMARADKHRCFFGIIKRWTDNDGTPQVFSKICMPDDGFIVAQSSDQKTLGKNLDEICKMLLDEGLHNNAGVSIDIFDMDFFLN
jgi:hypothetical protein